MPRFGKIYCNLIPIVAANVTHFIWPIFNFGPLVQENSFSLFTQSSHGRTNFFQMYHPKAEISWHMAPVRNLCFFLLSKLGQRIAPAVSAGWNENGVKIETRTGAKQAQIQTEFATGRISKKLKKYSFLFTRLHIVRIVFECHWRYTLMNLSLCMWLCVFERRHSTIYTRIIMRIVGGKSLRFQIGILNKSAWLSSPKVQWQTCDMSRCVVSRQSHSYIILHWSDTFRIHYYSILLCRPRTDCSIHFTSLRSAT